MLLRKQIFFILFTTSTSFTFFSSKENGNVNVNVNVNQGDMNSTNNNHLASHINLNNAITLLKSMVEKCKEGSKNLLDFSYNNKYQLTVVTIAGLYLYILYNIQRCKEVMNNQESWCCWNDSMETTELIAIPYSKIHKQIISDIQKKYVIHQSKIEFLESFNEFIQDIKQETKILKTYINLHNKLLYYSAQRAFFIKNETLQLAKEKLQRIMFIYNTFITWHTDRNIDKPA